MDLWPAGGFFLALPLLAAAADAPPPPPEPTAPGAASAQPAPAVAASAGWADWFDLNKLPFLPVPEIDTAPQSGLTVGLIPVILSNNAQGEINQILAPDIIYSQYFGWGARWRTFEYPTDDERWHVVAGAKQHVEREFDAEYELGLRREQDWSWIAHAMFDRSGTGRFFGLGNNSLLGDQTTYINSQSRLEVTAARNITSRLQLAYRARADTVTIEQSTLDSLPSIQERFPTLLGIGETSELQQRLVLSYDSRDSPVVPRKGEHWAAFTGFSARALGSSNSYSFFGLDVTSFQPVGPDLTVVAHAAVRYMPSYADAPFWALSDLGGDRSIIGEAQPLRAYGEGRFVDRNSFAASLEARTWVRSFHLFNTDLKLELAPFLDSGRVFHAMSDNPLSDLHVGGGMGFRLVASPFVVGYLDIGFGNEKLAVFSGINYPF